MTELLSWPAAEAMRNVVDAGLYVPRRVELSVPIENPTIHPGEPLRLCCYLVAPPDAQGQFPFRNGVITFTVGNATLGRTTFVADRQVLTVRTPAVGLLSLAPQAQDASAVWRLGDKELQIDAEFIRDDESVHRIARVLPLTVISDVVNADSWQWTSPAEAVGSAEWKRPYILSGSIHNPSQHSSLTARVTLWEQQFPYTYARSGEAPRPGQTVSVMVAPLRSAPVEYRAITQDWTWLTRGVWTITGASGKRFRYHAKVIAADEYGNEHVFDSQTVDMLVEVSEAKMFLGAGATFAAASAAALALSAALAFAGFVTAIGAPFLATAAAGAYAAATALGGAALDPPEPDPEFEKRVPLDSPVQPVGDPDGDSASAAFMRNIADCAFLLTARWSIEGKILGALQAEALEAANRQRTDYNTATDRLMNHLRAAGKIQPEATAQLSDMLNDPDAKKAYNTWETTTVPDEVQAALAQAVTPELAELAMEIVKNNTLSAPTNAPAVTNALVNAIERALSTTEAVV